MTLAEAIKLARIAWHAKNGRCTMCASGDVPINGMHREKYECGETMDKYEYVRNAKQTREHTCHWPGCRIIVKPALWGCRHHWFALPRELRDKVWAAYRPGQEEDMNVSQEYINVMEEVRAWINDFTSKIVGDRKND